MKEYVIGMEVFDRALSFDPRSDSVVRVEARRLLDTPEGHKDNTSMPVPRIGKEDLRQRLEAADVAARPLVIDVRLKYPYEHSAVRLPGALRLPSSGGAYAALARDREIVAYDSDPDELVSSRVAAELIRLGYRACALKGGIAEWVTANFPVEPREGAGPAPAAAG